MPDELELIRAAVAGDRQAFDDLVSLKRERVVRTAFQITGDLEDALDVGQAVFLKLWRWSESSLRSMDSSRSEDTSAGSRRSRSSGELLQKRNAAK